MRVLVDECLPARHAAVLRDLGHDAVHVSEVGLLGAPDEAVMAKAAADSRILLSADTDFGELLAVGRQATPSLVLLRGAGSPDRRLRRLLDNLDQVAGDLASGAIVVVADRIRVRRLPMG
jgi:predicted nuclease of predicted toxin-antitoxin system